MTPAAAPHAEPRWQRHTRREKLLRWLGWLLLLTALLIAWRLSTSDQNWEIITQTRDLRVGDYILTVPDAVAIALDLLARAFPPDLGYLPTLLRPIWDTLNIATLGTLLGLLLSAPVALLAARNTTPHPALRALAMGVIVSTRSINTLIWGMLLVLVVGPGVLAGVLAIAIRSIGFIAKLTYEAIEEVDAQPVLAVRATGAGEAQVITHAIVPQVKPAWLGVAVFRWDINIRESAIIGYVGAGGLGLHLRSMVDYLHWDRVSMILLVVIALVLLSESVSAAARRRVT